MTGPDAVPGRDTRPRPAPAGPSALAPLPVGPDAGQVDVRDGSRRSAGHRVLAETSDLLIEAWAPTREGCMVQAVQALVACFADVSEATPGRIVPFVFPPDRDDRQLFDLLAECLSVFEIFGVVPVSTQVDRAEDGSLAGCFETADVAQVSLISRPPEGVRLHELEFEQTDGWHCLVGVDR